MKRGRDSNREAFSGRGRLTEKKAMARILEAGAALGLAAAVFLGGPDPASSGSPPLRKDGGHVPEVHVLGAPPGVPQDVLSIPGPSDIEAALRRAVDGERKAAGLQPLRLSTELAAAARDHSRTMAAGAFLSHSSPDGRSPSMRLVLAGLFFSANGENVASSRSFNARLFHAALMASPEHRANILDPEFDTVGIGAAGAWPGTIYVTQDFTRAVSFVPGVVAEERAKRTINARRAAAALPPVVFWPAADEFARRLSAVESAGGARPPFPEFLGETLALISSGPEPLKDGATSPEVLDPDLTHAGAGVVFARTASHPGGAYYSALLLASESRYDKPGVELALDVLAGLNALRTGRGLAPLRLNERASEEARRGMASSRGMRTSWPGLTNVPSGYDVLTYSTLRPDIVPEELLDRLLGRSLVSVGIGVVFAKPPDHPRGSLHVVIVLPAGFR